MLHTFCYSNQRPGRFDVVFHSSVPSKCETRTPLYCLAWYSACCVRFRLAAKIRPSNPPKTLEVGCFQWTKVVGPSFALQRGHSNNCPSRTWRRNVLTLIYDNVEIVLVSIDVIINVVMSNAIRTRIGAQIIGNMSWSWSHVSLGTLDARWTQREFRKASQAPPFGW